jgi:hypothetical protein
MHNKICCGETNHSACCAIIHSYYGSMPRVQWYQCIHDTLYFLKQLSKRPCSETEVSSHAGKEVVENIQGANGQGGRPWGWDEEGVVMDINILLSEFGDFSDFFQEEELDFGEVDIL